MSIQKYKETLHNYEPEFNPADWQAMKAKMQDDSGGPRLFIWQKSMKWAAMWVFFAALGSGGSSWLLFNHSTTPEAEELMRRELLVEDILKDDLLQEQVAYHVDASEVISHRRGNGLLASNTAIQESTSSEDIAGLHSTNTPRIGFSQVTFQEVALENVKKIEANAPLNVGELTMKHQPAKLRKWSVSAFLGFDNKTSVDEEKFTQPLVGVSVGYDVSDRVKASVFVGKRASKAELAYGEINKKETLVGGDVKYYLPVSKKTSVYAGAGLAYKSVRILNDNQLPSQNLPTSADAKLKQQMLEMESTMGTSDWQPFAIAGISHKVSESVTAFVETAQGVANIRGGVQVRFK